MRGVARFFAAVLVLLTVACSSAREPVVRQEAYPYQTVMVNTPGVTGVDCFMATNDRRYKVKAPGTIMVHRSPWPMTVSCYKGNYMRGANTVTASYAPKDGAESLTSGAACLTCAYPNTISVAMALDPAALQHDVQIFR